MVPLKIRSKNHLIQGGVEPWTQDLLARVRPNHFGAASPYVPEGHCDPTRLWLSHRSQSHLWTSPVDVTCGRHGASHWGRVKTLAQRKLECSEWSFGIRTLSLCLGMPKRQNLQQKCGRKPVLGMDRVPSRLLSTSPQNLEWKNPLFS